jgi:hypothetical protein
MGDPAEDAAEVQAATIAVGDLRHGIDDPALIPVLVVLSTGTIHHDNKSDHSMRAAGFTIERMTLAVARARGYGKYCSKSPICKLLNPSEGSSVQLNDALKDEGNDNASVMTAATVGAGAGVPTGRAASVSLGPINDADEDGQSGVTEESASSLEEAAYVKTAIDHGVRIPPNSKKLHAITHKATGYQKFENLTWKDALARKDLEPCGQAKACKAVHAQYLREQSSGSSSPDGAGKDTSLDWPTKDPVVEIPPDAAAAPAPAAVAASAPAAATLAPHSDDDDAHSSFSEVTASSSVNAVDVQTAINEGVRIAPNANQLHAISHKATGYQKFEKITWEAALKRKDLKQCVNANACKAVYEQYRKDSDRSSGSASLNGATAAAAPGAIASAWNFAGTMLSSVAAVVGSGSSQAAAVPAAAPLQSAVSASPSADGLDDIAFADSANDANDALPMINAPAARLAREAQAAAAATAKDAAASNVANLAIAANEEAARRAQLEAQKQRAKEAEQARLDAAAAAAAKPTDVPEVYEDDDGVSDEEEQDDRVPALGAAAVPSRADIEDAAAQRLILRITIEFLEVHTRENVSRDAMVWWKRVCQEVPRILNKDSPQVIALENFLHTYVSPSAICDIRLDALLRLVRTYHVTVSCILHPIDPQDSVDRILEFIRSIYGGIDVKYLPWISFFVTQWRERHATTEPEKARIDTILRILAWLINPASVAAAAPVKPPAALAVETIPSPLVPQAGAVASNPSNTFATAGEATSSNPVSQATLDAIRQTELMQQQQKAAEATDALTASAPSSRVATIEDRVLEFLQRPKVNAQTDRQDLVRWWTDWNMVRHISFDDAGIKRMKQAFDVVDKSKIDMNRLDMMINFIEMYRISNKFMTDLLTVHTSYDGCLRNIVRACTADVNWNLFFQYNSGWIRTFVEDRIVSSKDIPGAEYALRRLLARLDALPRNPLLPEATADGTAATQSAAAAAAAPRPTSTRSSRTIQVQAAAPATQTPMAITSEAQPLVVAQSRQSDVQRAFTRRGVNAIYSDDAQVQKQLSDFAGEVESTATLRQTKALDIVVTLLEKAKETNVSGHDIVQALHNAHLTSEGQWVYSKFMLPLLNMAKQNASTLKQQERIAKTQKMLAEFAKDANLNTLNVASVTALVPAVPLAKSHNPTHRWDALRGYLLGLDWTNDALLSHPDMADRIVNMTTLLQPLIELAAGYRPELSYDYDAFEEARKFADILGDLRKADFGRKLKRLVCSQLSSVWGFVVKNDTVYPSGHELRACIVYPEETAKFDALLHFCQLNSIMMIRGVSVLRHVFNALEITKDERTRNLAEILKKSCNRRRNACDFDLKRIERMTAPRRSFPPVSDDDDE